MEREREHIALEYLTTGGKNNNKKRFLNDEKEKLVVRMDS